MRNFFEFVRAGDKREDAKPDEAVVDDEEAEFSDDEKDTNSVPIYFKSGLPGITRHSLLGGEVYLKSVGAVKLN